MQDTVGGLTGGLLGGQQGGEKSDDDEEDDDGTAVVEAGCSAAPSSK